MAALLTYTLIGVIATAVMIAFFWTISGLKLTNADMIKAVGSLYSKSEEAATLPGLVIVTAGGVFFTYVYVFLFSLINLPIEKTITLWTFCGTILGAIHGNIVAILLAFLVAERHPLEKYRQAGLGVAIFHFLGHIIYGVLVGLLYGWFSLNPL